MYIKRKIEQDVLTSLGINPVTAIIGPRQCGKSTLSKVLAREKANVLYLDLEKPSDLRKLDDPEWFLTSMKDKLIIIDEIQRKPELFPVIRSLTDEWAQNGKFLILGSASKELLRQSSETLAGRISYKKLTPFLWSEVHSECAIETYLSRGGFPRSLLAKSDKEAYLWLDDFIITFLERDLLFWSGFSTDTMRRLWQMLAHYNGQTVNYNSLGRSLGVSNVTIRNYIDLLAGTFMVDILPPYNNNFGKRVVKAPKIYIPDTGIICRLLELSGFDQIAGHQAFGSIWESMILSQLKGNFPGINCYFYRTSNGAEIDILIELNNKLIAIECKASKAPSLTRGSYSAIETTKPDYVFVVAPVEQGWPMTKGIEVVSPPEMVERLGKV
jgi:hypothetical protein